MNDVQVGKPRAAAASRVDGSSVSEERMRRAPTGKLAASGTCSPGTGGTASWRCTPTAWFTGCPVWLLGASAWTSDHVGVTHRDVDSRVGLGEKVEADLHTEALRDPELALHDPGTLGEPHEAGRVQR